LANAGPANASGTVIAATATAVVIERETMVFMASS
jgi:hypothetical protein